MLSKKTDSRSIADTVCFNLSQNLEGGANSGDKSYGNIILFLTERHTD
jgi:hypothetical protein